MQNPIDYSGDFFGIHLTHDQCWEEYENMLNDQDNYDAHESGMCDQEFLALNDVYYAHLLNEHYDNSWFVRHPHCIPEVFFDREAAFEQKEKDDREQAIRDFYEGGYPTDEEVQAYYDLHHIEPANEPYWKTCVSRIDALLKSP